MDINIDFNSFIRTLYKETHCSNLYIFTVKLFKSANNRLHLTDGTVCNWFKTKKRVISTTYTKVFKDATTFETLDFDDDNFLKFLKDTCESWEALRDNFKAQFANTDINHAIDVTAADEDVFFESIMIQFKIFVAVPYKKKAIRQIFDMFDRDIRNSNMMDFINAEPAISYTYGNDDEVEDAGIDWDEAVANFSSTLQSFGIDYDDDKDNDYDYDYDNDDDEDDNNDDREIESATISLNAVLIDILKSFLITIENSFNSIQPETLKKVTRQEDSYIKKIYYFIEILKNYNWVMDEMTICDGNIWTATDERMSVAYCDLIVSCHQRIKKTYDEICDIGVNIV